MLLDRHRNQVRLFPDAVILLWVARKGLEHPAQQVRRGLLPSNKEQHRSGQAPPKVNPPGDRPSRRRRGSRRQVLPGPRGVAIGLLPLQTPSHIGDATAPPLADRSHPGGRCRLTRELRVWPHPRRAHGAGRSALRRPYLPSTCHQPALSATCSRDARAVSGSASNSRCGARLAPMALLLNMNSCGLLTQSAAIIRPSFR